MKKRALAILMAALTASTMFAVPTFAADYSGEDPQLEKNVKILTIWAEDNDNGMLLNKICEDYQKNVNPKPETDGKKGFVCKVCGYIYEGDELPDDFICPLCKHGAADFEPIG